MPSLFAQFPNEVIELIAANLPGCDLKSLRSTAKFVRDPAERALFGSITITPHKQSLETLVNLPENLRKIVRKLVYDTRHLKARHYRSLDMVGGIPAMEKYNGDVFPSIDLTVSKLHDHVNLDRMQEETDLLSIALRKLRKLQSVTVTDGSQQYHDNADAPLPGFHLTMLRRCGLEILGAAMFHSPLKYTACRSSVLHFAIQRADKRLARLAYHASDGMDFFYKPSLAWPQIAPGKPFLSLRAMEVCLPRQEAGPRGITYDYDMFEEAFFAFLSDSRCNIEELRLNVTKFDFEQSLEARSGPSGYFTMHFPKEALEKLKVLELAGVFVDQGIPRDDETTFQGFLEGHKNTLERLVLRDVKMEYLFENPELARPTIDSVLDQLSWPCLIDFMHEHLKLKEVQLQGRLMSKLFSWDTRDKDNISRGMSDDIKNTCVRRRIERYILNDPACKQNPLQRYRPHITYDVQHNIRSLHLPKSYKGDWSWKPLKYELKPYTDVDRYVYHTVECRCMWCLQEWVGEMAL